MLFKIVFRGEIGFDFDPEEVKENLQKFCGFDRDKIDRLFSGGSFVLKTNLDRTRADHLREAFLRLGAFVDVVPMPAQDPLQNSESSAPPAVASNRSAVPASFTCPSCGKPQAEGESCVFCGVYFAKFARAQERRAREYFDGPGIPPLPGGRETTGASLSALVERLTAQGFLFRCGLLLVGLVALRGLLGSGLTSLGFIILPVVWLLFIMVGAMLRDQDVIGGLGDNLDFATERTELSERRRQWLPKCTYGVILLDLLLYYLLVVRLAPDALADNLAFYPAVPTFWNVPLSAVLSLFLHAGGVQLWGCVAFLWVLGPGVEKRLGSKRFLGLYLLSGVSAGIVGVLLHLLLGLGPLHGLGSSGAIAGLLGLSLAWREDHTVEFSLPVTDLLSLLAPAATIRVRLDVLALAGLFFYAGLGGPVESVNGAGGPVVEYLCDIGRLATGVFAGFLAGAAFEAGSAGQEAAARTSRI